MSLKDIIFKRIFDILASFSGLLILWPLLLVVAIMVKVKMPGGSVLFVQKRVGKDGKLFKCHKFRSMTMRHSGSSVSVAGDSRITPFGAKLRHYKLDELPELFNIIKGDMSVIGPRPLPPTYNDYYTENEKKRFLVRGGLLPPDSVSTDPMISWDKQFEYEADYGANMSFKKDWDVFCSTFRILLNRSKSDYGEYIRQPLSEERKNMKK